MGFNVIVFESDPQVAQSLAGKLSAHFHAVHMTHSSDELRERIARSRPEAVILDMEFSRLSDVRNLHHEFPSLPIVCLHRIPDEQLWVEALEAGASDVCRADDVQNVLASVLQSVALAKSTAA
jgi:two-component system KDP operon response regulator KdpE